MEKIVNNTKDIKHLPNGGVLNPGKNELPAETIEANLGHPGFDADVEAGRIESPYFKKLEGEYPVKIADNGWYELSNGEKVLGESKAMREQEKLDKKDVEVEDEQETGGE